MVVKGAVELFHFKMTSTFIHVIRYLIADSSRFTSVLENHVQTELEF